MTTVAYFAESLDGFIADADGGMGWLYSLPNPSGSDHGYGEFIAGIDVVVMGRNTFDSIANVDPWPYPVPVVVLTSRPLPAGDERVEAMSLEPHEAVAELTGRGLTNIYVDGGVVVTNFLEADDLDEFFVHRIPIVLGSGIRMFGRLNESRRFDHISTKVYDDTMVRSHYRRAK